MIYYFCSFLICLALIIIGRAVYSSYRDNKAFRGDRVTESPIISKLLDGISPEKDSGKYRMYDDFCFCLNSNWSVRDLYFTKALCFVFGLLIGISIAVTNTVSRYNNVFSVDAEIPVEITKDDYNILIDRVTFTKAKMETDLTQVETNISRVNNSENEKRYKSISSFNLYTYLNIMRGRFGKVINPFDLLVVIGVCIVGYWIPSGILKFLFKSMEDNVLFEFDDLETMIYMMSQQSVYDILFELENSSLFMRQLFCSFTMLYKQNSDIAYRVVESHAEFPFEFKTLIRYCSMIESDGPDYVKTVILASKENTERKMAESIGRRNRKRMAKIKVIITISFILGMSRIIISLV